MDSINVSNGSLTLNKHIWTSNSKAKQNINKSESDDEDIDSANLSKQKVSSMMKSNKACYSNHAQERGVNPKTGSIPNAKIAPMRVISPDKEEIMVARFDHDSVFVALAFTNGYTGVYSVGTGHLVNYVHCSIHADSPVTALRWRPPLPGMTTKMVLVTGATDGTICHWHINSGKLLHRSVEEDNQILALDYNHDGSCYATAGKDFCVRVYDETTKALNTTLEKGQWRRAGHSNRIFSLKFVDDQQDLLISGGWDSNVHIWDLREGKSIACIYGPEISGDSIDYKDGVILTGSCRIKDQLELWDFGTRKRIRTIDWEYGKQDEKLNVYGAEFSKQTSRYILACGSVTNEARLFDQKADCMDFAKITGFKSGLYTVDFAPNQEMFVVAGGDGDAHILNLI